MAFTIYFVGVGGGGVAVGGGGVGVRVAAGKVGVAVAGVLLVGEGVRVDSTNVPINVLVGVRVGVLGVGVLVGGLHLFASQVAVGSSVELRPRVRMDSYNFEALQ